MKLTAEQYKQFKDYIDQMYSTKPNCIESIKNWLCEFGDEKLSHNNCLIALRIVMTSSNEAYNWVGELNLNDNHWATAGRKYFKEFKKEHGI